MTRYLKAVPEEYYHVFNRGNDGRPIFRTFNDRRRFLLTMFMSLSDLQISKTDRLLKPVDIAKREAFEPSLLGEVLKRKFTTLTAFALMDNHFHFLIREDSDRGVARFMQRLQNSYTKYYNARYEKKGHLFQGAYKLVHVKTNDQLIYLSTYIHRNPRELPGWRGKEALYPWSSCRDYLGNTDWQGLLDKSIIIDQMENGLTYKQVLETSIAKEPNWQDAPV